MTDTATHDAADAPPATGLWTGDRGSLAENSRRVLLALIKGPYVSSDKGNLWAALLADQSAIEERLNDLFLELVIDPILGFAFVRNVRTDELAIPTAVRAETLTFLDTAMLLVLRQILLHSEGERRVIVGRDEVFEQLAVYRGADRDETDFGKRLNASWRKMRDSLRIVHATDTEDRVEISPVLALIVTADTVRQLSAEYERIAASSEEEDA
ncbi:DUF4194 domain-containing protein [Microbacterium sp. ZW T5_56]|uniref:DUF4194 domain-containing protein n=1 Tax=Microbacterium sp. ZW T5_56 TaxID=3378081 RepID=UPI0038534E66